MLPLSSKPYRASRHGLRRTRQRPVKLLIALATASILLVLAAKYFYEACDTRAPLSQLLVQVTDVLVANGVKDFWLDKGTLLGAIREKDLIQWEYDVDISMMEEDCKKMDSIKDKFAAAGLFAYNRSDYIEQKRTRIIIPDGSFLPSYQSPYLTVPCYRIYDGQKKYFMDIYWKNVIPKEKVKTDSMKFLLPPHYAFAEDLLCDAEGMIPEMHCCGGCDAVSTIFPLQRFSFAGRDHFHIPHKPNVSLETQFGKSWTVKMIKGYKKVTCLHIIQPQLFRLLCLLLLGSVGAAVYVWVRGAPYRMGWTKLRNHD